MTAEQTKEMEKVGAIDWALIWPLILPLLKSLIEKNNQGVRQGRAGCCTAFLEEYMTSRNELAGGK